MVRAHIHIENKIMLKVLCKRDMTQRYTISKTRAQSHNQRKIVSKAPCKKIGLNDTRKRGDRA